MAQESTYLNKEHKSLKLRPTPQPHTLNSAASVMSSVTERKKIVTSLTASLGIVKETMFIKMPSKAEWLVMAGD